MMDDANRQDERPEAPSLEERLVAYHEALLSGKAVEEDNADLQLAGAQRCLKLIETIRRQSESSDSAWLFSPGDHRDSASAAQRSEVFDMLLHCSGPPRQIGRFQIERTLGEGGFGIVFLATDPDLNRQVALKVPRPETLLSPAGRGRFLREAEAAALLNHPHLVPVYEVGRAGSLCYIVQAYCHGASLDRWLVQHQAPVSSSAAARLILVLAEAVQHAHSRGVLHRDIKPSNVLLASPAGLAPESISEHQLPEVALLSDFGLALLTDQNVERTRTGSVLGTPAYMAPEQAEGRLQDVGTATDVYALGVMLYELLTAQPPFCNDNILSTLQAVRAKEPQRPRQLNGAVPADLEAICLKCLEKEPRRRYATAKELAEDLTRYLAGELVSARHTTRRERLLRWCRRNPTTATLLTAVLLLVLLLGTTSLVASLRLQKKHDDVVASLGRTTLAEREARRAEQLERQAHRLANQRLYQLYLATAELGQRSGRTGQRFESLKALAEARRLAAGLPLEESDWGMLRRHTVTSLTLPDLRPGSQRPLKSQKVTSVTFDPDVRTYVSRDAEGNVSIHSLDSAAASRPLENLPLMKGASQFRFSADGQLLAAMTNDGAKGPSLLIWDRETSGQIWSASCRTTESGQAFDFTPTGQIVYVNGEGQICIDDPRSDSSEAIWKPVTRPSHLRVAPSGEQLAIVRGSEVEILNLHERAITVNLDHPHEVRAIAWSPDSQRMAIAGAERTFWIWNLALRERLRCEGHQHPVITIAFHPQDNLIASSSAGGSTYLWDAATGKQLLVATGRIGGFSRDGHWLSFIDQSVAGRWEFAGACSYTLSTGHKPNTHVTGLAFARQGGFLFSSGSDGVRAWELSSQQAVASLSPTPVMSLARDAAGRFLITSGDAGVQRRSMAGAERLAIGASQSLVNHRSGWVGVSADGQRLVVAGTTHPAQVIDLLADEEPWTLPGSEPWDYVTISRDGRWVAASSWAAARLSVFDVQSRRLAFSRAIDGRCRVLFAPDGHHLAIADQAHCLMLRVGSWKPIWQKANAARLASPICFTADSSTIALVQQSGVMLLAAASGNERLCLPLAKPQRLESLTFSSDQRKLAAGTTRGEILVWDLEKLHAGLSAIGLKQEMQELHFSTTENEASMPQAVEMVEDEVPWPSNSFLTLTDVANEQQQVARYARTLKDDPVNAIHYRRRADSLRRLGRTAEARSDYRRALELLDRRIELHPEDMDALQERGWVWLRLEEYERADTDLSRHLEHVPDNIRSLYGRAAACHQLGLRDKALELYTRLIERHAGAQDPHVQNAYSARSYMHRLRGDWTQAIADLKQALKIRPENSWNGFHARAHNSLAWCYLTGPEQVRDLKAAREHAMQAVALAPHSWAALSTRGSVHHECGEYETAIKFLQSAIDANPQGATGYELFYLATAYYRLNEKEKARHFYQQAVQWLDESRNLSSVWKEELALLRAQTEDVLHPAPIASDGQSSPIAGSNEGPELASPVAAADRELLSGMDYLERGDRFHKEGATIRAQADFRRAIELFSEEIAAGRDDAELYHRRGHAHFNLEQYEQAALDFAQAGALQPTMHLAEMQGHALRDLSRWEEAIAAYTRAIELDEDAQGSYYWRALGHMTLGDLDQAHRGFERSLELRPIDRWPCYHLAWIYTFGPTHLRQPERAVELARQAVELDPKSLQHREVLAAAYYRQQRFDEALEVLEQLRQSNCDTVELHFLFAFTYAELGQYQRMHESYQKAHQRWREQPTIDAYWLTVFELLKREATQLDLVLSE